MRDERPGSPGDLQPSSRDDPQPVSHGHPQSPPGMPRGRGIPGEIGWKPDPADVDYSGGPDGPGEGSGTPHGPGRQGGPGRGGSGPGLVLRLVSIVPFLVGGVVGVIALVGWAFLFIFGAGDQETIWAWASGRPAGEVVTQVALVLLLGMGAMAVTVGAMWAGLHGFTAGSGMAFWTAVQVVFGLLVIGMVALDRLAANVAEDVGLGSAEWWLLFAVVALGLVAARLRARAARPQDVRRDGRDAAG